MTGPYLRFDFPHPLTFSKPVRVLSATTLSDVRPVLRQVQEASEAGLYAAGFVAYEAAPAFDSALRVQPGRDDFPLAWFGIFRAPSEAPEETDVGAFTLGEWEADTTPEAYAAAVEAIREGIGAGRFYQVNHTFRLRAPVSGDGMACYRRLRRAQGGRYGAFLDLGRWQILSASPELFFRRQGDRVETRPMKGTRRRGRWTEEDEQIASELAASEKDRAENVMIVDLLRSDLGRLAVPGSVRVPRLFETERYPTVWQMTSQVEATLMPGVGLDAVFGALFPCGSITGAPKVSAMGSIADGEDSPRGVYCGALGYVTPDGEAVFSVGIRTATLDAQASVLEYGVGSGITWDSTVDGEYREAWSKAAALSQTPADFDLLETLRWEGGTYALLDRHLDRLTDSARYFGFSASREAAREALFRHGAHLTAGVWRVRLLVGPDGVPRAESRPLDPLPDGTQPVVLASSPVSRADRFLCHKTTRREVYDAHRAQHPQSFDVLLWNEEGELTEFTIGNLAVEIGGRLWTPPRDCGLLAGTLRAELLARGEMGERILRKPDLDRADRLWLLNGVRGFVPVTLSRD